METLSYSMELTLNFLDNPSKCPEGDSALMDAFLDSKYFLKAKLMTIQCVWRYKKLHFLLDILCAGWWLDCAPGHAIGRTHLKFPHFFLKKRI